MGETGGNADPPIMELLTTSRRTGVSSNERGAILVLTALVMMLMLMIAAFATDVGAWYRQGQEQTRVADLGSLNGIQAYEQFRRAEFNLNGYDQWSDFTAAERRQLDFDALEEATDAVMDLLAVQGHPTTVTGTNPDISGTYESPGVHKDPAPGGTPAASWITFVTDDGLTVTVTRNPDLTITVTVEKEATQYFSHIIADAPTIARSSTATLSNCGAICNVPFTINPPFIGFTGVGNGDGFKPLRYPAAEQVWAVNHHRRRNAQGADIVCMSEETRTFCDHNNNGVRDGGNEGLHSLLNYATHNRPAEEYLNQNTGKLYFTARNWNDNETGLVCFNTNTLGYCGFTYLWDQTIEENDSWPAVVNATGPWVYGSEMYIMAQHGQIACVDFSMNPCGTWNTSAFGHPDLPGELDKPRFVNGEMVGDRIYFTHIVNNGTVFHCWDIGSSNNCGWPGAVNLSYLNGDQDQTFTFLRYTTAGSPTHICAAVLDIDRNGCVRFDGVSSFEIGGLNAALGPIDNSWAGDTFTWDNKRTFFAGGNSNQVGCWSWVSGSSCGYIDYDNAVDENGSYPGATNPYAFEQVTYECVMGLGHNSRYFSFNPADLSPCVDTTVDVALTPCMCADAVTPTWGTIVLPDELLSQVTALDGTLLDNGGNIIPGFVDIDLLAANGELDLSGLDPTVYTNLTLVLDVEAMLDINGIPVWTTPINSNLELVVQPTLTD